MVNIKTTFNPNIFRKYSRPESMRIPRSWREWVAEKILRVYVERFPDYFNHAQMTAARMVEAGDTSRMDTFYTVGGKMEIEFRFVK